MKKNHLQGIVIFPTLFFLIMLTFLSAADEKEKEERIVEKVTVTNVEVPVRVLHRGKPVDNLTAEDFEIFEGRKKMKIHGFFVKRKKIKLYGTDSPQQVAEGEKAPPRSFVLVFSITEYNVHFKNVVDYLFDKVLKENDRLLIFANNKTFNFPNIMDKENIKKGLIAGLKSESRAARVILLNYIQRIETYLKVHDFRVQIGKFDMPSDKLQKFLQKYLLTWNEYKKAYLTPKQDRFYFFSKFLENLKGEKWVLNFYQFDLFPRIRLDSETMNKVRDISTRLIQSSRPAEVARGRMISTLLNQVTVDLNLSKGFPVKAISKLFYKVNATFHSFFVRSTNKAYVDDLEYQEISSDLERTLKGITQVTGGKSITSNDMVQSLETVREMEDVYYLITYAPDMPRKTPGKLKVKVKKKKYKVYYDDNFRANYIERFMKKMEKRMKTPDVAIKSFSFKRKTLSFTIKEFLMKAADTGKMGMLNVRIRVLDEKSNPLFDQSKQLKAHKNEMKITLDTFKAFKKGEYNFLIDVRDLFTGKTKDFHKTVRVK
ncbi:MAG: hypothetical protein GY757_06440 [bacterium]|nr:hypothetical protein [bacterium]